jgi:hypothetical protein
MEYDEALKEIKQIKKAIRGGAAGSGREAGWFFILQGAVWLVGFMITQFFPEAVHVAWIVLNSLAGAITVVLAVLFSVRKPSHVMPGLWLKIVVGTLGFAAFGLVIGLEFGVSEPHQVTLLIVMLGALCYFAFGLVSNPAMSVMGALLGTGTALGNFLIPQWFFLAVSLFGGGTLIATGVYVLTRRTA